MYMLVIVCMFELVFIKKNKLLVDDLIFNEFLVLERGFSNFISI